MKFTAERPNFRFRRHSGHDRASSSPDPVANNPTRSLPLWYPGRAHAPIQSLKTGHPFWIVEPEDVHAVAMDGEAAIKRQSDLGPRSCLLRVSHHRQGTSEVK